MKMKRSARFMVASAVSSASSLRHAMPPRPLPAPEGPAAVAAPSAERAGPAPEAAALAGEGSVRRSLWCPVRGLASTWCSTKLKKSRSTRCVSSITAPHPPQPEQVSLH
jgi:hypothetical protein